MGISLISFAPSSACITVDSRWAIVIVVQPGRVGLQALQEGGFGPAVEDRGRFVEDVEARLHQQRARSPGADVRPGREACTESGTFRMRCKPSCPR